MRKNMGVNFKIMNKGLIGFRYIRGMNNKFKNIIGILLLLIQRETQDLCFKTQINSKVLLFLFYRFSHDEIALITAWNWSIFNGT
jgi:hypothetical protein